MNEIREDPLPTWTDHERAFLDVFLATLIPADPERGLPSGAEVGFLEACRNRRVVAFLQATITLLDEWTNGNFVTSVVSERAENLRRLEREQLREFREVFRELLMRYYINKSVREAIGIEPRPPFPFGHAVIDGDLSLLEQVYEREPLYRTVSE